MTDLIQRLRTQAKQYDDPQVVVASVDLDDLNEAADALERQQGDINRWGHLAECLSNDLTEREKQVERLERELVERDVLLAEKKALLIANDDAHARIAELEAQLELRSFDVASRCDRIVELEREAAIRTDQIDILTEDRTVLERELAEARRVYNELIFAVASKYPDESRHETALRYIRQAEAIDPNAKADAALAGEGKR